MTVIKKRRLTWLLLSVLALLFTVGIAGYKMYTKPHRNIEATKAISVSSIQLATDYENDELRSNSLYLDKVLDVTGEITEISKNQKGETIIALKGTGMSTVRCTLEGVVPPEIKSGGSAMLKGICTGYLTDVVLVRCIVYNK